MESDGWEEVEVQPKKATVSSNEGWEEVSLQDTGNNEIPVVSESKLSEDQIKTEKPIPLGRKGGVFDEKLQGIIDTQNKDTGLYPEKPFEFSAPKASQDQAQDNLKKIFSSEDENAKALWNNPAAREKLYNNLSKKGYNVEQLKESGERFVNARNKLPELSKAASQSKDPALVYEYATALQDVGKNAEAFSVYTELVKSGSQSADVYKGMARSLYKLGNKEEAQRALEAANQIEQQDQQVTGGVPEYQKGVSYVQGGSSPQEDLKTNEQAANIGQVAGALEKYTPLVSQGRGIIEGADHVAEGLKQAKEILTRPKESITDAAGDIGEAGLRSAASIGGGAISYLMNTTPVGLAFVEATQGVSAEGTKKIATPIVNAAANLLTGKDQKFTPDEALGMLGAPIATIMEKSGVKDQRLKDVGFIGDAIAFGVVAHTLSKPFAEGKSGEQVKQAGETATKIIKGEKVDVEELKNLNEFVYENKAFRESFLNPTNDLRNASKVYVKQQKVNSLAQDIQNSKSPVMKSILQQSHDKEKAELETMLQEQSQKDIDVAGAETHNEIIDESVNEIKADLENLSPESKKLAEETISEIEKQKKEIPIFEMEWEGEQLKPKTDEVKKETNQTEVLNETPVQEGSVGVGGDVKLGDNPIVVNMSLPFNEGVNTGLVKNSKGAVYHDRNSPKLEKLGYSKEQIDNLSQTELNEILAKNIENPNVATSAKLPIAEEQTTTQEFLNEASKEGGRFAELANKLKDFFGLGDTKTTIVKGLTDFFGGKADGDYGNNQIRIDEKSKKKLQVFLHEAIHKVTVEKLLQFERGDYSKLSQQDIDALQNLTRIFDESKIKIHEFLGGGKGDRTKGHYGFTNVHEFISEAFTNPEFQHLLKNLPTEGKSPTIFKQFLDAVAKFLGLKDASILNDIFHHTENLREQSLKETPKAETKNEIQPEGTVQVGQENVTGTNEVKPSDGAGDGGNGIEKAEEGSGKKKSLANRVYEGTTPEEIKAAVEKNGLKYDVEHHIDAEKNADAFISEVGTENALAAVRNGELGDGAAPFVYARAIDKIGKEILSESNPDKKLELINKEADLIDEFDKQARSSGRFGSALQAVYQVSDLGYKLGIILKRAKEANQGEITPELQQKFTDLTNKLDSVNKRIAEIEKQKEAEIEAKVSEQVEGIVNDIYKKMPSARRQKADKTIAALEAIQKRLRENVYDATVGIPVAVIDAGITVIKSAIKAGVSVADAVELGIKNIKGKVADWKNEDKFRKDMLSEFEKEGISLKEEKGDKDALERYKDSLLKSKENYEKRIRERDFSVKKKGEPPTLDSEAFDLLVEKNKLKEKVDLEVEKLKLKNRTTSQKLNDGFADIVNLPKSLVASADMSAPLRQGAVLSARHPVMASKAAIEMFRQAFSEAKANDWLHRLKASPEYADMKKAGLYFAEPTAKLSAKEEQFISNIAHKIPIWGKVVKGSERAYTGYLNKLRADVFSQFHDALIKEGLPKEVVDKELKSFADFVNNASGRGSLGKGEEAAPLLNGVFFSPRYAISRFNLMNPAKYIKMSKRARMEALKTVGTYIGMGSMVLALAKAGGAEVEKDIRSSDAGKIKIGNTRYDIWAGFQQWAKLIAQIGLGEKKTLSGKVKKLGEGYKEDDEWDILSRFARTKLSPTIGALVNAKTGKDVVGTPTTPSKEALRLIIPLWQSDVRQIAKEEGWGNAAGAGAASFFGVGVQNYSNEMTDDEVRAEMEKRATPTEKKTEREKREERHKKIDEEKKLRERARGLGIKYIPPR